MELTGSPFGYDRKGRDFTDENWKKPDEIPNSYQGAVVGEISPRKFVLFEKK